MRSENRSLIPITNKKRAGIKKGCKTADVTLNEAKDLREPRDSRRFASRYDGPCRCLQPLFLFLSDQLGRTVKISTRVSIWQNTISAIFKHPFIGYGAFDEESTYIRELLGLGNPHSEFLWVGFEAGIVGMIAFIIYIHLVGAQYNKSIKNIISVIIYAAFCGVLLSMITDDYLFRNPFTLLILCMTYNISQFDDSSIYDNPIINFHHK